MEDGSGVGFWGVGSGGGGPGSNRARRGYVGVGAQSGMTWVLAHNVIICKTGEGLVVRTGASKTTLSSDMLGGLSTPTPGWWWSYHQLGPTPRAGRGGGERVPGRIIQLA